MKLSLETLERYIVFFWSRRRTKNGYFLAILLLVIITNVFTSINTLPNYLQLVIYLLCFVLLFIIWLFMSGRRFFPSKKIKIAFALKSADPSSQKIILLTILRIKDKLKLLGILDHFSFYEIGSDIFETNEQAELFGLKRKLNLIIHGTVYGGKNESSYRYDLRNFFFTYNVANTPKDSAIWPLIHTDIGLMLGNRYWLIDENNDLNDIAKVADNLFEIILSIIAIALTRSQKTTDLSILLIEKLLPILEQKIDPEKRNIKLSKDKTELTIPLDLLRTGRLKSILSGCYINSSRIFISDGEYAKALNIIEKGLNAGADKVDCYPALALAYYHLGDTYKAEEYTEKLNDVSRNHPIYLVNKAFFSIIRKEYKKATECYTELRRKITDDNKIIIDQVISFISDKRSEEKHEHAYLYSIGILTYNFIDKKEGISILSKFIQKCSGVVAYTPMLNIAERLCKGKI